MEITNDNNVNCNDDNNIECSICLNKLYENNQTIHALVCGHKFHCKCIIQSLINDSRCPLCRDTGDWVSSIIGEGDVCEACRSITNDNNRYERICGHVFHETCLINVLRYNKECQACLQQPNDHINIIPLNWHEQINIVHKTWLERIYDGGREFILSLKEECQPHRIASIAFAVMCTIVSTAVVIRTAPPMKVVVLSLPFHHK